MLKTIGIIGGMGPAATADLMMKIISMTAADSDQDHIPMIIDNNTRIPDRTAAILSGGADPVPEMTASAKRLEAAGADFIIIGCNTAHYFVPAFEKEISIPVVSMLKETARALREKSVKCAAVLATDGTVKSGLYAKALAAEGIEDIYPTDEQQRLLMSVIYDYIKKGITDPAKLPHDEMLIMAEDLKSRGAEALIMACTELPLAFDLTGIIDDTCMDPTRVLAAAAIREAGAKMRLEIKI